MIVKLYCIYFHPQEESPPISFLGCPLGFGCLFVKGDQLFSGLEVGGGFVYLVLGFWDGWFCLYNIILRDCFWLLMH